MSTNTSSTSSNIANSKKVFGIPLIPFLLMLIAFFLTLIGIWYVITAPARYHDAITPTASFALPEGDAPNYSMASNWALVPSTKPEGAWETPWGVDVFFIHGTTSNSPEGWNSQINNPDAELQLQSAMLPNYAGPFQKMAPIYAPKYRQVTLHGEYSLNENSQKAFNLAYEDVELAFQSYMQEHNQGRAIILAGVGQGGVLAKRLLRDQFNTDQMKRRLAVAYLIETPTNANNYIGDNSQFQICNHDEQINCIASWNTIGESDAKRTQNILSRAIEWDSNNALKSHSGQKFVCFNPSMGNTTQELISAKLNRGAANATNLNIASKPDILKNAVSSQCVDGFLVVSNPDHKTLKSKNNEHSRMFAPAFNLFYSDISFDAAKRATITSAWLDKHGAKPAPPLPPMKTIEIAPITKIEKILGTE